MNTITIIKTKSQRAGQYPRADLLYFLNQFHLIYTHFEEEESLNNLLIKQTFI